MSGVYEYGMWAIVLFSVGLFVFSAFSFLAPQGRVEWRNFSAVAAFFIALFTEIYGFLLSIYLLTDWLGGAYPMLEPFSHKFSHLWVVLFGGSNLAWALVMGVSLVLLLAGYVLPSKGWRLVHGAIGRLVTDGVYAYARHPQYTGLFLVILAFSVLWPTLLAVLVASVLSGVYVHLAQREKTVMQAQFGVQYDGYTYQVAAFSPPLSRWRAFFKTTTLPSASGA